MTMTETEIRHLYAVIIAYDNRRVSEANITAWTRAAVDDHWTYDEASEAVHEHYRTSTDFLMPGHIHAIVKARRNAPGSVKDVLQLDAANPAEQARVRAVMEEVASQLRWNRGWDNGVKPDLSRQCPHCHAGPGRPCTITITRGAKQGQFVPLSNGRVHASRNEAAS